MESQIAAGTAAKGSLVSVGSALKAFVVAHPIGTATAGGVALGMLSYYMLGRMFGKKSLPAPVSA